MRNAGGYGVWTDKASGKVVQELDTFSCAHCGTVVPVRPKEDPSSMGGWCSKCSRQICVNCVGLDCMPVERWLDKVEKGALTPEEEAQIRMAGERRRIALAIERRRSRDALLGGGS